MKQYQKEISLLVMGVFFLIAYFLAFEPMFESWANYRQKNKAVKALQTGTVPKNVQQMLSAYESKLSPDSLDFHASLNEFVSAYCHKHRVTLIDYPLPVEDRGKYIKSYWHELVVEGKYVELIKLVRAIEENPVYHKIVSAAFYTEKVPRKRTHNLYLKLYLKDVSI